MTSRGMSWLAIMGMGLGLALLVTPSLGEDEPASSPKEPTRRGGKLLVYGDYEHVPNLTEEQRVQLNAVYVEYAQKIEELEKERDAKRLKLLTAEQADALAKHQAARADKQRERSRERMDELRRAKEIVDRLEKEGKLPPASQPTGG